MEQLSRVIVIPDSGLDEATRKELLQQLSTGACKYCAGLHDQVCPRVKHIIYHPGDDRVVREVEFWADSEWNKSGVIFAEDLVDA